MNAAGDPATVEAGAATVKWVAAAGVTVTVWLAEVINAAVTVTVSVPTVNSLTPAVKVCVPASAAL